MWTRTLTCLQEVPTDELLLRVLGPDPLGAAYWVTRVRHEDGRTHADLAPVPPGETRIVWDTRDRQWIQPDAVTVDPDGVAQLTRMRADDRTA
jgi:hypothetical protein